MIFCLTQILAKKTVFIQALFMSLCITPIIFKAIKDFGLGSSYQNHHCIKRITRPMLGFKFFQPLHLLKKTVTAFLFLYTPFRIDRGERYAKTDKD